MSPSYLDKNVPMVAGLRSRPGKHGDINNESERTGTSDDHGGGQGTATHVGAGGGVDGGVLSPRQAHLAAVSGRWGCRPGASAARPAQCAAQAAGAAGAGVGEIRRGTLRGFWAHADGRASVEGKGGGRS